MVIVLGAGITGLAAAYELTRRGIPFAIVDAAPRAGGLILTEHVDGFTIDAGPDSLLVQKPAATDLCAELGLSARLMRSTPPRTAFVAKRRRLHPLPSPSVLGIPTSASALARYDLLSLPARARIALEPLVPRGAPRDESVASFFTRRFGAATVPLVAEPLLGGIHAGDVEQLSIASLFPRLVEAERKPGKVLRTLSRGSQPLPDGLFRALQSGMTELVDAIVSRLPANALALNTAAHALARAGSGWRVTTSAGTIDGAAVIVSTPAHAAARLFESIDADSARLCREVPYVSTASVAFGFRRGDVAHDLAGSGFVVARRYNDLRITACTWVSSKWAHRAPADRALLRAFVGGAHDPSAVDASDDELASGALRDLDRVLGIRGAPVVTRVFRWRHAGAQHHVGHRARMKALAERLRSLPGLYAAGSGFESIGIPDCVAHGRSAAAHAADYVTMQ